MEGEETRDAVVKAKCNDGERRLAERKVLLNVPTKFKAL